MAITGSIKSDLSDGIPLTINTAKADTSGPSFIYSAYNGDKAKPSTFIFNPALKGDKAGSIPLFSYGNKSKMGGQTVIGALKGIAFSGVPTTYLDDGTFGRHMQVGVTQSMSEGNPSSPCLQLTYTGFWRFRWVIKPGPRSIYINAKQPHFLSGSFPYVNVFYPPSIIVKSNSSVGLNADISSSATVGQEWVQISVSFTATGTGVCWVELWNNNTNEYNTPAFFDHIITL